jgi:thioredoxin 1
MSNPINVNGAQNFKDEVLNSELPVLVDFWAPWCGPCQMMAPVLESLAKKFDGKLKIVKIDTEQSENQQLAMDYQIQSIPNLKLFKNGTVTQDFIGYRPEEIFTEELKLIINQ